MAARLRPGAWSFIHAAAVPVPDFGSGVDASCTPSTDVQVEDLESKQVRVTHLPPYASELWPGGLRPGDDGRRVYLPVTKQGAVRALLPMDVARVTQSAARNASAPQTRLEFARRAAVAAGLRAAVQLRLPLGRGTVVSTRDDGLETTLAHLSGLEAASVAFHFGPPRANLKPVAKVYDERSGAVRAVAKFGCTPLTKRLVATEAAVLRTLAGRATPGLEIPSLLHEGSWGSTTFVLQSVVRFPGRHRLPSPAQRLEAERQVASTGTPGRGPLRSHDYSTDLTERLRGMTGDDVSRAVADAGHRLLESLADEPVASGGWHGDWAPQNVCVTDAGVGAWDWERWAPDRPCGFDTLHFRTQELLSSPGTASAGVELIRLAPSLLAAHQPGLPDAVSRRLAALYLVEIGHRYLADGQRDTPSAAGRMDTWLVPALLAVADDEPSRRKPA